MMMAGLFHIYKMMYFLVAHDDPTSVPKTRTWGGRGKISIGKLNHWGWVTHICIGNLTIIGSDNGLTPGWHQAIIWTNAGILLNGPLGTNFSEILTKIHTFSFKKMHLNRSSAKWWPFYLGLNVFRSHQMMQNLTYSLSNFSCPRLLLNGICQACYRKTSNISRTLVSNKIVDNSDVVVGAAPTISSNTWLQWIEQRQLHDETRNISILRFGATNTRGFTVGLLMHKYASVNWVIIDSPDWCRAITWLMLSHCQLNF